MPWIFIFFSDSIPLQYFITVFLTLHSIAIRPFTEKRLHFFRESSSGYNITSYYLAFNFSSMLVTCAIMTSTALMNYYVFGSLISFESYLLNYLLLGWTASAWGKLLHQMKFHTLTNWYIFQCRYIHCVTCSIQKPSCCHRSIYCASYCMFVWCCRSSRIL